VGSEIQATTSTEIFTKEARTTHRCVSAIVEQKRKGSEFSRNKGQMKGLWRKGRAKKHERDFARGVAFD
jgi:hypothetical protein